MNLLGRAKALISVLLFVSYFSVPATAQGSGKIAVFVTGGEPAVNKAFAIDMSHMFDRTGRFSAIERQEAFIDAVYADETVASRDVAIIGRAKEAGAQYVCFLSLNFALGSYLISARIVDVETGETTVSGVSDSPLGTLSDLRAASVNVIRSLRGLQSLPAVGRPVALALEPEPEPEPDPEPEQDEEPAEVRTYKLTVNIEPIGGGTVSVTSNPQDRAGYMMFNSDAPIALAANANTGYVFVGWSGDAGTSSTARKTVMMRRDLTLTASFRPASPPAPPQPRGVENVMADGRERMASSSAPAPRTVGGVDMSGSISEIVRGLINETVGKRFGQAVGNAIADIVVQQVNAELAKLGSTANANIGEVVGKVVERTVTQEIAKRVPGPAGRLGGSVGKAVGQNVERAVNDILSGKTPGASGGTGAAYKDPSEDSPGTRAGLRLAWNASKADVDVYGGYGISDYVENTYGAGWEFGLAFNTRMSPMWSFNYGVNLAFRRPVDVRLKSGYSGGGNYYSESESLYQINETALTFPALFRLAGTSGFAVFVETGAQLALILNHNEGDSYGPGFKGRSADFEYVLGTGLYLGRNVALTNRLIWGTANFIPAQSGRVFQNCLDLTLMFKGR